jgi:DNA end-binding protein Ku
MPRSIWTGSISFGLVNVPVKAYTAVRDHDVHFHQLDKKSGSRIRYKKVAEESGKEVDTDDIVLGFEVRDGSYVTFDDKELEALRPESTRTIDVTDFVSLDEIDPIYYENTYWLAPDRDTANKAYQLLLAAMEDEQRVGIGTVVLRDKQHLAAVRPLDGALAMSTMRFADEVLPRSEIEGLPRRAKADPKALKMAKQVIDGLAGEWEPKQYHDTYTEALRKQITHKQSGKQTVESTEEPKARVLDLMAALEASVDAAKKRRSSPARKPARRSTRKSA